MINLFIMLTVAIAGLVSLWISFRFFKKSPEENSIRAYLFISSFDGLLSFIITAFFQHFNEPLDVMLVLTSLYGPLFYFCIKGALGIHIHIRKIYLHLIPFLSLLVLYITFYFYWNRIETPPFSGFMLVFGSIIYGIVAASIILYGIWGLLFSGYHSVRADLVKRIRTLVSMVSIILVCSGLILIGYTIIGLPNDLANYQNRDQAFNTPPLIYLTLLGATIAVILFQLSQLGNRKKMATKTKVDIASYGKSIMSKTQLEELERNIRYHVETRQVFLEDDFSLAKLAKLTSSSKHHLSQALTFQIGKTFSNYTNECRITYAKNILLQTDKTIMEVAYESGFASHIAFHRNFKGITGQTPSEFRKDNK